MGLGVFRIRAVRGGLVSTVGHPKTSELQIVALADTSWMWCDSLTQLGLVDRVDYRCAIVELMADR